MIHIEFEYRGFVANSLTNLDTPKLELRSKIELMVVNSMFKLQAWRGDEGFVGGEANLTEDRDSGGVGSEP